MREDNEIKKLVTMTKVLTVVMIIVCIVEFMSCAKVNAAVITGDTSLAGVSYWIDKYIEKYGHSPFTEDIELLAEVMWHENGVNGDKVMYYTGAVVFNRVKSSKWPNTVKGVLYEKGQYATTGKFYTKPIPPEVYLIALRILKFGTPDVPENVVYQAMFKQGSGIWKAIPSVYSDKDVEYFCYE